jgi:hypothetical protein
LSLRRIAIATAAIAVLILAAIAALFADLAPGEPTPSTKIMELAEARLLLYSVSWESAFWDGCGAPDRVTVDEPFLALARLHNQGSKSWAHRGSYRLRLGSRWLDASEAEMASATTQPLRDLDAEVAPGARLETWIRLTAPATSGRYTLELDVMSEDLGWFSQKGAVTCRAEVEVEVE